MQTLKLKVISLANESSMVRQKERHILENARVVSGILLKKMKQNNHKHGINEKPKEFVLAERLQKKINKARSFIEKDKKRAEAEAKNEYSLFEDVHRYRTHQLRKESRATQLAYAFMRGVPYISVEKDAKTFPEWDWIEAIAITHNPEGNNMKSNMTLEEKFEGWVADALSDRTPESER